jgi:hypothetical protein
VIQGLVQVQPVMPRDRNTKQKSFPTGEGQFSSMKFLGKFVANAVLFSLYRVEIQAAEEGWSVSSSQLVLKLEGKELECS